LKRAFVLYRVNPDDNTPWQPLPLNPTTADPAKVGKFLPEYGLFEESGPFGQVEFYAQPPADPDRDPPGLEAGGRYNFQTASLTKPGANGKPTKLTVGDRVEYRVVVYDRNPAAGRQPGESVTVLKTVVSDADLKAWLDQHDQSRTRLRELEQKQRGVFRPVSDDRPR
jgi:hypothetical protein